MPKQKIVYKPVYEHASHVWPRQDLAVQRKIKDLLIESYRPALKDSFILGIKDCTDQFKDLAMIFICKQDAKPLVLVQHFTMLSYLHSIPLVTLAEGACNDLGTLFANEFKCKRILALGIKHDHLHLLRSEIEQLIAYKKPTPNSIPTPLIKQIPTTSSSVVPHQTKLHP